MKQKQVKKHNYKKLWIVSGSAVLLLLLLAQMTFNVYTYLHLASTSDQSAITHAVINASRSIHKPAPVEPTSGKVYLPEARLVLPATTNSVQQILYSSYMSDAGTTVSEVQITTSDILLNAETKLWTSGQAAVTARDEVNDLFSEVPNLQACTRGVQLFFAPQVFDNPQVQLRTTKTLANGKTMYLYTDSTCKGNLSEFVDYVKQAQSY